MQQNNPVFFITPPTTPVVSGNSTFFIFPSTTSTVSRNSRIFIPQPTTPGVPEYSRVFISPPATPLFSGNSGFAISAPVTPVNSGISGSSITPLATPVRSENLGHASVSLNFSGQPALVNNTGFQQFLQPEGDAPPANLSVGRESPRERTLVLENASTEVSTTAKIVIENPKKILEVHQLAKGAICNGYHFGTKNT